MTGRLTAALCVVIISAGVLASAPDPKHPHPLNLLNPLNPPNPLNLQDPQRPVFRAGTERVRIDALVTNDNRPVRGLTAADFELLDNGVVQDVELAATAGSVSVAIALDLSGSVKEDGLEDLINACGALADALRPGDVAWLVTFADHFELKAGPVTSGGALRDVLERLRPGGGTSMWDALFGSLSLVAGSGGRALVLLFTDGADSTSWLDEDRALEAASRGDVVVEAIRPRAAASGLGPLEKIARATGGAVRTAESKEKMATQFVDLLEQFRLSYVLTYVPKSATPGWHDVEVKLKGKKGKVRTRRGYYLN